MIKRRGSELQNEAGCPRLPPEEGLVAAASGNGAKVTSLHRYRRHTQAVLRGEGFCDFFMLTVNKVVVVLLPSIYLRGV